jgi:hypothetical protein
VPAEGSPLPLPTVTHTTTDRYATPVTFGEHPMMMRPRDSHDLRLLDTTLLIRPGGKLRWIHDVFGNSVAEAPDISRAAERHFPDLNHLADDWFGGSSRSVRAPWRSCRPRPRRFKTTSPITPATR